MATAEGSLVASTARGCKALNLGGGVTTVLTRDAMTRGPAIDFPSNHHWLSMLKEEALLSAYLADDDMLPTNKLPVTFFDSLFE